MNVLEAIEVLKKLRDEAEALQGGWNGKDSHYMHEGDLYPEETADIAGEIKDAAIDLIEKLVDFNNQ